jgi:hypothetical protein
MKLWSRWFKRGPKTFNKTLEQSTNYSFKYKFARKVYKRASVLKEEAQKYIASIFPYMCEYCGTGYKSCPETNNCVMCGAPGIKKNE